MESKRNVKVLTSWFSSIKSVVCLINKTVLTKFFPDKKTPIFLYTALTLDCFIFLIVMKLFCFENQFHKDLQFTQNDHTKTYSGLKYEQNLFLFGRFEFHDLNDHVHIRTIILSVEI